MFKQKTLTAALTLFFVSTTVTTACRPFASTPKPPPTSPPVSLLTPFVPPTQRPTWTPWPTSTPRPTSTPTFTPTSTRTATPTVPATEVANCESAFSKPVGGGAFATPALVLRNQGKAWDGYLLPFIESPFPVEPKTLVCIKEIKTRVATYTGGTPGYRMDWDVRLVRRSDGRVLGAKTFTGGDLPRVAVGLFLEVQGSRPIERLLRWLDPAFDSKKILFHGSGVTTLAFSPDGTTLASGSQDRTVRLWNTANRKLVRILVESMAGIGVVAFSPDGKILAEVGSAATGGNYVALYQVETGKVIQLVPSSYHKGRVRSVAFSPDGKTLVSGSEDRTVKLSDVATGREMTSLAGHTGAVQSVAFSPDGQLVGSGSSDKTVRIWDAATGKEIHNLTGQALAVNSIAFSQDGKLLASGSDDATIILWDVLTGQIVYTLRGHEGAVTSIAFSPDGKTLASGSKDTTVKLWDVAAGQLKRTLTGHAGDVTTVAFSLDSKTLASGSSDTTIKLWDVAPDR